MEDEPLEPPSPAQNANTSAPDRLRPQKSFLTQRFAKIGFGQFSLLGYSVAGEESVVQVPELNVCFDVGRCPAFCLTSDVLCITHGHMDHIAGIGYYLSQRYFQGLKRATVVVPEELVRPVEALLKAWRDIERQQTPYEIVGMRPGHDFEVRRDLLIRAVGTHHGGPSLGYVLLNIREKLRSEFAGLSTPEIVALKQSGVEIQYRLEVPLVAYLGDTAAGPVFDDPDVAEAKVLVTECTFYEDDHRTKAKAGRHLHVTQFAPILERLRNEWVVISHVSRRTGVRRARSLLKRIVGAAAMERVVFLNDYDGARDEGDLESVPPAGGNES